MKERYNFGGRRLPVVAIMVLFVAGVFAWDINEKYTGPKTFDTDLAWHPDILPGYEARYVNQGMAFDGPCRSTIVRKKAKVPSKKGYLYIHGFNDYFFQSQMGDRFVDSGYHFYAVDLRRYGRSKEPWQYPFNIRDQKEYFADIDSAIVQMQRDGVTDITLGGHSTGGLTVILYGIDRGPRVPVKRIVTNSPFLGWNFNPFMRNVAIPAVSMIGPLFKNSKIKQDKCDGYAYSLLKQYDGEWEYNTDWKMIYSPPVTFSWVHAINSAQNEIMKHPDHMAVPLLVMHSSRKIDGCNYTPEFKTGDCVLNPYQIAERGAKIGKRTYVCAIDSGIHDLILSELPHREQAYECIFSFIRQNP